MNRSLIGLILLSVIAFTTQFSFSAFAQFAPDIRDFRDYDLDRFLKEAKPMSKAGLDVFYRFDALHFEAVLTNRPSLWPEGEQIINNIHKLNMIPQGGDQVRYSLVVVSKKGKKVKFHLQNVIAESIIDRMDRQGEECCVGNRVDIYARYVYNAHGEHGLVAVRVNTHWRDEKIPPS